MRRQAVDCPISSAITRGGRFCRNARMMPSTFATLHLFTSTICLSSTSRTSGSISRSRSVRPSATEHLQRDGDERNEERDDDHRRNEHVADDTVAVLTQVVSIVHQDE